jgi:hypothetical protein
VRVKCGQFTDWVGYVSKPLGDFPHAELIGVEFIAAPVYGEFSPDCLERL